MNPGYVERSRGVRSRLWSMLAAGADIESLLKMLDALEGEAVSTGLNSRPEAIERATNAFARGRGLGRTRRHREAIKHLEQARALFTDLLECDGLTPAQKDECQYSLATTLGDLSANHLDLNQLDEALRYIKQEIAIAKPASMTWVVAQSRLAQIRWKRGEFDAASRMLQGVIWIAYTHYEAVDTLAAITLNYANMLSDLERFEVADRHYAASLDLYNHAGDARNAAKSLSSRAIATAKAGDYQLASQHRKRAIDIANQCSPVVRAEILHNQAVAWAMEGYKRGEDLAGYCMTTAVHLARLAIETCESAGLAGDASDTKAFLARILADGGRKFDAATLLEPGGAEGESANFVVERATMLASGGDTQAAIALLESAFKQCADRPEPQWPVRLMLAQLISASGEPGRAAELCWESRRLDHAHASAMERTADLLKWLIKHGRSGRSLVRELERVVSEHASDAEMVGWSLNELGRLHEAEGRNDSARAAFRDAMKIAIGEDLCYARYNLAGVLDRTDVRQRAELYQAVLNDPRTSGRLMASAKFNFSILLGDAGDLPSAASLSEEAYRTDGGELPTRANAAALCSSFRARLKDAKSGRAILLDALNQPWIPAGLVAELNARLAGLNMIDGDVEGAKSAAERAIEAGVEHNEWTLAARLTLALCWAVLKQPSRAIEHLDVIERHGASNESLVGRARHLREQIYANLQVVQNTSGVPLPRLVSEHSYPPIRT